MVSSREYANTHSSCKAWFADGVVKFKICDEQWDIHIIKVSKISAGFDRSRTVAGKFSTGGFAFVWGLTF